MKTKLCSILFALVMVLSLSAGVLATDFTETWDEETVLTVFNDLDIVFPDLFADIDSDFLWSGDDSAAQVMDFVSKDITLDEVVTKAPVDTDTSKLPYALTASYDPCGDGLIKFEIEFDRDEMTDAEKEAYSNPAANVQYGPEKYSYIRAITAKVGAFDVDVVKCDAKNDVNCHYIKYDKNGKGKLSGYLYYPEVLSNQTPTVNMTITFSDYMTALWDVPVTDVTAAGVASPNSKTNYCQGSLEEYQIPGVYVIRAKYDENTGEARFQATIRNFNGSSKGTYAIPAEVAVPVLKYNSDGIVTGSGFERYTDYTCKYTVYNNVNAAPRTDYCEFGKGIALDPNTIVRFDVTIDHLSTEVLRQAREDAWGNGNLIRFMFRVGGMDYMVGNSGDSLLAPIYNGQYGTNAAFVPAENPCPEVSRMAVMDPLKPFMTFFEMDPDEPIKTSGAYGVYEGGVWGLYQKCGRFAYLAVRLKNDGLKTEVVNLKNVAVAVNGGTLSDWGWVLSSVETDEDTVELASGEDVVLILRAKVTDVPSQLNADTAMTAAVNFLDYGFYVTGKVYSDHNNANCTVAP